jgi:hypothetical protein
MAPEGFTGVNVLPWPVDTASLSETLPTAWVVIEAFGCDIPSVYQTAMASASFAGSDQPRVLQRRTRGRTQPWLALAA